MKGEDKKLFFVLSVFVVAVASALIIKNLCFAQSKQAIIFQSGTAFSEQDVINSSQYISEKSAVQFPIEVNLVTKEQLMEIDGIGEKTASRIIDYRDTKGRINSLNELLNVEGIGEKTLANLKKFLYVQNEQTSQPSQPNRTGENITKGEVTKGKDTTDGKDTSKTPKISCPLDINSATCDELMSLKGIGETKANSIISYRNSKGRFSSIEEIMKVDGIGEKIFSDIKPYICVRGRADTPPTELPTSDDSTSAWTTSVSTTVTTRETTTVTTKKPVNFPININTATFDELMQIPDMTAEAAYDIIEHRSKDGCKFVAITELINLKNFNFKIYMSIEPYITI